MGAEIPPETPENAPTEGAGADDQIAPYVPIADPGPAGWGTDGRAAPPPPTVDPTVTPPPEEPPAP